MPIEQLPLAIRLPEDTSFETFMVADNAVTVSAMQYFLSGTLGSAFCFYLYGESGGGRSHLLQAACHWIIEQGGQAFYFSLHDICDYSTDILDGLDGTALVAFDDIEVVAGNRQWELALFHFYNRCRDNGTKLLFSGKDKPMHLDIGLADLVSRLAWGGVYPLVALNEPQKRELLQTRARARGFDLHDDVVTFLFNRCSRSLTELMKLLDKLDRDSIRYQRKITIPFVKQSLGL